MNSNQDLALNQAHLNNLAPAPNQIDNRSIRLHKAKEFTQENPHEHRTTAAQIYNLSESTLQSSLTQVQNACYDGQNKILQDHQTHAIRVAVGQPMALK